jgi:NAD(P)-dependent dehydrogenase (short-subunit alcohol dehydrogenase family)
MERLDGRVAVVTGGASGVGRALGRRFAAEGMHVVLADVEQPALDRTVAELRDEGPADVSGVVTDVADPASVAALRDAVLDRHGAVHLLCNNAGVGAGATGRLWEHDLNDWRWGLDVNVWGVIHGIKAFVPHMVGAGDEGHVVNTSSGNGGVAPLPSTPIYALTKAAVVTVSECLYAQLRQSGSKVSASVLFPGPHMLRTGLFSSWRNRPPELHNADPSTMRRGSIEAFEERMAAAGVTPTYTAPEEVADQVVEAVRADRFWILPASDHGDERLRARTASMLERTNPTYLTDLVP